jgi:hypothetical protein
VIDLLDTPVLKLPYLALPLRPGTSGLLAPELGYSGRDGLRLMQGLYLAPSDGDWIDGELSGGWIQKRGARARTQLRIERGPGAVDLQLEGLHDSQRARPWRGSVRGRMLLQGSSLAAAASPDLISDPQVLLDLHQPPARVFAPHLRSRLWGWWRWSSLVGTVSNDLYQDLDAPVSLFDFVESSLHGSAVAALSLLPTRIVGPLFLLADSRLVHFYPVVGDGGEGATALSLAPALGLATRLGSLRLSGRGLYRYEALWSALDPPEEVQRAHLVVGELRASLPLQRIFSGSRLRHLLEPAAGISWADWETHARRWRSPDQVRPLVGTAAFGAIRNVVWFRRSRADQGSTRDRTGVMERKLLEAEARIELPLQPEDPGETGRRVLVGGVLLLRPLRVLRTRTTATWELTRKELLELQAGICLHQTPSGLSTCAGYHHLRATRMVHLYGSGHLGWASPGADLLALGSVHGDQLFGELQARLGRVTAGIRLAGDPLAGELSYGQYWVDLSLGCGCYKVGLRGATRAGQRWPDLMARLTLGWSRASCD